VRRLGTAAVAAQEAPGLAATRFVCVLADGRRLAREAPADLPEAVADALRTLHARGEHVTRIELGGG